MSDAEDKSRDEDKVQRELEKQIALFARLFAMLDTDSDGERQSALLKLTRNMERINQLQEELTGTPGTLSFVTLLEKIENGGGGSSEQIAEYEQLIAEYQAANDTLKQAETMLRAELERAQLLQKYDKANKIEDIDLGALTKKTLTEVKASLDKLDELVAPAETPEGVEGLYNTVLDEMVGKDIGAGGKKPRFQHRIFAGLMRGLNYPVDADDAVKLQTLAATQAQLLKDTEALQEKVAALRESLPALQEALDIAIFQSGEHPDFARAIREMQTALRQVQQLRYENNELSNNMARMRQDFTMQIHERDNKIRTQARHIEHLDTRLLQLLNDIDGGKNPIEADGKNKKSFADRATLYRKEAIDWTNEEALRARITGLAGRGAKVRAGSQLRPVTLQDVLDENHALHAYLARQKKDASAAVREGARILTTYKLLPQNDLDRLIASNENLVLERNNAHKQNNVLQNQMGHLRQNFASLQKDANDLRNELQKREGEVAILTGENETLKAENEQLKQVKSPSAIFNIVAGVLAGVLMTVTITTVLDKNADKAPPQPAPQSQSIMPAP